MKELITICASRPVAVLMAMSALVIAAIFSVGKMPLDRLPELSVPKVTVETRYPGMAAAEIRALLTIPVEDALSPVKGLQRMRSVSRDGASLVSLDFRWGNDPLAASALVREAIDAVYPSLPEGVSKPAVTVDDNRNEAHAIVAIRSLYGDNQFARNLAEYEIRARLRRIDGVGSLILTGGETGELRLDIDVPRLAARGISPSELVRLVAGESADVPAGNAREGNRELVVVSSGRPTTTEEFSDLLLPAASGSFTLDDAGDIGLQAKRRSSIFVVDGKEAVALEIYLRSGADPVRLSREIQRTLKEAVPLFSRDVEITLVKDSTPSLLRSIASLGVSAAMGAVAVIVALFLFIRRLQYSLLAALSIPVSAAVGICVLALAGKSLNGMSLGGLALGIGLVSDISVIVLDLLHRAFGERNISPSATEIGACTVSIAASSVASTVTTAVVFVPVIFLPGPLGSLFGDTAIALVASITMGWIYAQFGLPSLFRFFFGNGFVISREKIDAEKPIKIENRYRKMLRVALRDPQKIFAMAIFASIIGTVLLLFRPASFVSPDAADEVCVSMVFPPGTVLDKAADIACMVSAELGKIPFVETVYGRGGAEDEDVSHRANIDYQNEEITIRCVLKRSAKPEYALEEISRRLSQLLPVSSAFTGEYSAYLPKDRAEVLLGLSSALSFTVRGKDRKEAVMRTDLVAEKLWQSSGDHSLSVQTRPRLLRPELRLYPNREAGAYLGISGSELAETLYTLNEGLVAARLEIEGRPLDVRIKGKNATEGQRPESILEKTLVISRDGKQVYLGSLVNIERRDAESALARLDRSDVLYIDVLPSAGFSPTKIIKKVAKQFSWFTQADESVFKRYSNSLLLNVFLVLILLYMTMGAQFESFSLPLILMLSIPFSLAGAGPAMLLFNTRLDSGAVLGLIALFGLVVNNGLILFEIGDQKIREGYSPVHAVYCGAIERLRPVLITLATTIFALLPLALNPLGNAQKSMAAAMMGGLAASTCLSLFALPPALAKFFAWRKSNERG